MTLKRLLRRSLLSNAITYVCIRVLRQSLAGTCEILGPISIHSPSCITRSHDKQSLESSKRYTVRQMFSSTCLPNKLQAFLNFAHLTVFAGLAVHGRNGEAPKGLAGPDDGR